MTHEKELGQTKVKKKTADLTKYLPKLDGNRPDTARWGRTPASAEL